MKEKRAQVTIFVIIAILIVAGIAGFFIFRSKLNIGSSIVPAQLEPITNQIQGCVQATLEDGTKLVGLQGGYVLPPENALETNFSYIAYGYYLGRNTLVSKVKIEQEISKYIELTLPFCFDASAFLDYRITLREVKVATKIDTNSVSSSVNFPFTASKGENSWSINKKYTSEYKVKLGDMYSVSQNIISKEIQNPNTIDFSYLNSFDYDISILNQGNNIIVYSINDYDLNESGGAYTFRFANRIK